MYYKQLANTEDNVSAICLGTMTWGGQNTQEEAFMQLEYALDLGVNFIDTAEIYPIPPTAESFGKTEEIIGNWFKTSGRRNEVVLATKVAGGNRPLNWVRGNPWLDKDQLTNALEGSLSRLKTDYIDLYQLHWPNRFVYHFGNHRYDFTRFEKESELDGFREILSTIQKFIKEGKIRNWGLSNDTAWGLMKHLELCRELGIPKPVTIQNEYSLLCRWFDKDLAEVSHHESVGLLAWSPLAAGALSGKYLDQQVPEGSRRSLKVDHVPYRQTKSADRATRAYIALAAEYNLSPAQLAISFVLSRPFTTSAIVGATKINQLKENIEAINHPLDESCQKKIYKIFKEHLAPY